MEKKSEHKLILIWPVIIALIFLLTPYLAHFRIWGINHLAFVNIPIYAAFIILTMLCFIPHISSRLNDSFDSLQTGYQSLAGIKKVLTSILIFVFISAFFYYLRSATELLGDGYLRGDELQWGPGYLPLATEPLDTLLHFGFYKIVTALFKYNSHICYQIFSSLAGGVFLLVLLSKLRAEKNSLFSPLLIFPGLSGLQFYFGYVESYSLQYIGIFLFLLYGYEYLREGTGFHKILTAFTITFFVHFSTAYLLPAYCVLIYYGIGDKKITSRIKTAGLVSLILMAAGYIYFKFIYLPAFGRVNVEYLLSFRPGDYWIFSGGHLLDILNNFLLSGMFALLTLPLIIKMQLWKNFASSEKRYSLAVIFGMFIFVLFLDPKLGFARDWDLFASTGLCAVFIILMILWRSKSDLAPYRWFLQTAVCLALIFTAAFITVNQNRDYSIERFKYILGFYDSRSALGYETLAGQFRRHPRDESDLDEAIKYYDKAFELNHKTRNLTMIAGIYLTKYEHGFDMAQKPAYLSSIEKYARKTLEFEDSSALAYDYLMAVSLFRENRREALRYSDSILKYCEDDNKPEVYLNRGKIYLEWANPDSAENQFNQALFLDSNFAKAYGYLGKVYLDKGDKYKAIDYYLELLERDPGNELRPQIEDILRKLR